jgi:hypothetical protein
MRSRGAAVAVIACAITAAACTLFTGPKSRPVTISVTSDTIAAFVSTGANISWLQFTIPVSIHNRQSAPLTVDFCLASVDEASGAVVWEPVCAVDGSIALPSVAPGATSTFQWSVVAAISGPGSPKWGSQTIGGAYRVRLVFDAEDAVLSNVFVISRLTTSAVAARDRGLVWVVPRPLSGAFMPSLTR